jgi:hypothetical protein
MARKLTKNEINQLIRKRGNLLRAKNDADADAIQKRITKSIKEHFNSYPCDFIIETLTKFGQAPNIVYDDNSLFAVSSAGYQPVVTGKEKLEGQTMVFIMEKDMWKPSIREAIWHYLQNP